MMQTFLDTIGNWNPQLFRELKGRLKLSSVLMAGAIAIGLQVLIIGSYFGQLPVPPSRDTLTVSTYPDLLIIAPYERDRHPYIGHVDYIDPIALNPGFRFDHTEIPAIRSDDALLAINGEPVPMDEGDGLDTLAIQNKIRGQRPNLPLNSPRALQSVIGTYVTLTLSRRNQEVFDVSLPRILVSTESSHYCLSNTYCTVLPGTLRYDINWTLWYADVFRALSWSLLLGLLVIGIFSLSSDLERERQDGTLNFIRLSPQPSHQVLIGKVLGVPILAYIGAALILPAQHGFGLKAGLSIGSLALWDGVLVLGLALWYALSLLASLAIPGRLGLQPWLWSGLAVICTFLPLNSIYGDDLGDLVDLLVPSTLLIHLYDAVVRPSDQPWATPNLLGISAILSIFMIWWSFWLWAALNRRFQSPTATLLSKSQSYLLVLGVEIGLVVTATVFRANANFGLIFLLLTNIILFYGLMVALLGQRQTLVDWARYQSRSPQLGGMAHRQLPRSRRVSSTIALWVWGDRSPNTIAIGINLAIAMLFVGGWQTWYTLSQDGVGESIAILWLQIGQCLGAFMGLMILVQLVLLLKNRHRNLWATGAIGANLILPGLTAGLFENTVPLAWTLSPLAWLASEVPDHSLSAMVLLGSVLSQIGLVILGQWWLNHTLRRLSTSEFKQLTATA